MSDPAGTMKSAPYEGLVRIEETGPRGMLTLRGDLGSAAMKRAVKAVTGLEVPGLRRIVLKGVYGVGWMSPDELLLLMPHGETGKAVATAAKALGRTHSLVANVSDARCMFRLSGDRVPEVLAKLAPVDMAMLDPDILCRTRLAQVPAAFWRSGKDSFDVVAFRSVTAYVLDLLKTAATPGSEVGAFP